MNSNHIPKSTPKSVQLEFALNIKCHLGALVFPVPDGQIHRFDDPEGAPRNQACWYLLSLQPTPHGAYGNWRKNSKFGYRPNKKAPLSVFEIQKLKDEMRRTRLALAEQKRAEQELTAQTAKKMWQEAFTPDSKHPYLLEKSISPSYLKQIGDELIVNLVDATGQLVNIQRIDSLGRKRFLRGGKVKGCFALAGEIVPTGKLYICEGWATGMTLYAETGIPAACAMSCHNLHEAGNSIKTQFPDLELVIAGDDDRWTKGNPGRTAAIAAALALGSSVRFPKWPEGLNEKLTDFNDLYRWNKIHEPK